MNLREVWNLLQAGLAQMQLSLDRRTQHLLVRYLDVISHNNFTYHLTPIRDIDVMVSRHILDSLSIKSFICGETILDVGTGAGFPGIPLAIAMPNHQFILIDGNYKKMSFLKQAVNLLGLSNVKIIHRLVENYISHEVFDCIISRTFGTLSEFLLLTQHLASPHTQWLAMKSVYPLTEMEMVKPPFQIIKVHPLHVPFIDAERNVVEVKLNG